MNQSEPEVNKCETGSKRGKQGTATMRVKTCKRCKACKDIQLLPTKENRQPLQRKEKHVTLPVPSVRNSYRAREIMQPGCRCGKQIRAAKSSKITFQKLGAVASQK